MNKKIEEMLENNKKIIKENNLKNWQDVFNYTLTQRLADKEQN